MRNGASAVSKAFQGQFLQDFEVAGNRFQEPPLVILDVVKYLSRLRHCRSPRRGSGAASSSSTLRRRLDNCRPVKSGGRVKAAHAASGASEALTRPRTSGCCAARSGADRAQSFAASVRLRSVAWRRRPLRRGPPVAVAVRGGPEDAVEPARDARPCQRVRGDGIPIEYNRLRLWSSGIWLSETSNMQACG